MRMRVLGRKFTAIACGVMSVGALALVSASPASAKPAGALATAEFGVRLVDDNRNGQCVVNDGSVGDSLQWVPEGQYSEPLVIDTDSRSGGCRMTFGFNNADGSLTGLTLSYIYQVSGNGDAGQCPGSSSKPVDIPIFPIAFPFRYMMDRPIYIDTDGRRGWCDLTFQMSGRTDVALDVVYEFNGDSGQCKGALPLGTNQPRTVQTGGVPVTIGLDTDNRGGACFLSFRLRHI
ncbi:hypothetical protein JOF56_007597 [Kibdelosporangium banguiense]|uniref:Secreted protein n=1 Tax=Kibdelosporangium banguiense TaxID=1365924 RepID=A0ABS4TS19_9PSEU|nr:hypothetical protein [Kibdelosporangium banguiense]MBP2327212.1 hypothetical protein [Kibdelosporangium banguiense]